MSKSVPQWVEPVMRAGYAARGAVYLIVGGFAFLAAHDGGAAPGTKGALDNLLGGPVGVALLAAIAAGLLAYAVWRGLCALWDLEDKGGGAKGWIGRGGQLVSGLTHLALAVYAGSLVWQTAGSGGGQASQAGQGGGSTTESGTAMLMQQPFGRWLVAGVGLVVIGVGIYHFVKAHKETYKETLAADRAAERLAPVVKFGLDAHGAVIAIIGGFFIWAALTADPQKAGGIGQALDTVRGALFGQVLLGLVGAGLVAFAVYCWVEARYRVVPVLAPGGASTLGAKARQARHKAEHAARQVAE